MILIDYQDRRPIYEQIVDRFQVLIVKGILKADSQLPSVRKLAMELSINPNTIQKAYTILEQQGFIYPIKGRGNFVAQDIQGLSEQNAKFYDDLKDMVKYAMDRGISKDDFIEHAATYYGEERA